MGTKKILIGTMENPDFEFEGDPIRSIQMVEGVDIVGTELTIDQITITVDYAYTSDSGEIIGGLDFDGIMSADGYLLATSKTFPDLRQIPHGTLLRYFHNSELRAKAYVQNVSRIGTTQYKITGVSAVGLLDKQHHNGGLYNGSLFPNVLADIIGGAVPYTVAAELANLPVYGWLPYDTRRNNLHQLLFACGVMVGRNTDGDMDFRYISNAAATQIPDGRIYSGGSVDYAAPITAVAVTEHSFMELPTDETVTVYDNTDGSETADNAFLTFQDAPLHNLQTTGTLTLIDSGVNWAIVSGTGVLTGQRCTHSSRILTRHVESTGGQKENVASVENVTLVSVLNSANVAERVLSYYAGAKTVSLSFVTDGERPGTLIAGNDPYMEPISGFLTSMESNVSSITKANAKVITGYVPTQGGNNYSRAFLFDGSGTIDLNEILAQVPSKEGDLIQAVLISGGYGGEPGADGGDGERGSSIQESYGTPGNGGEGGAPGAGGRVYTVSFRVSDLAQATLAYNCGSGGLPGASGGDTTLGAWSSSNGASMPYGVANIFTGEVYAAPGAERGADGGAGSSNTSPGQSITFEGQTWTPGAQGPSVSLSGASGEGGYGGGAAVGSNGNSGLTGRTDRGGSGIRYGYGGKGGDGADAASRVPTTVYGGGGLGGHGGGGAGIGGKGQDNAAAGGTANIADNGKGGKGGTGGTGGPGLLIIYV